VQYDENAKIRKLGLAFFNKICYYILARREGQKGGIKMYDIDYQMEQMEIMGDYMEEVAEWEDFELDNPFGEIAYPTEEDLEIQYYWYEYC